MKKIELKNFNETIYYDECDNGLKIYMWINERVNNFYATLSVKYGSIDTTFKQGRKTYEVPHGTAHFLEHIKFNEDENHTAHDYFNKLGSSINAFTTFDYTSYEVFSTSNIKENIEHLLDYVENPFFSEKLIEKEKGIIKEEVRMSKNNPYQVLYYGLNNSLYHESNRKYYVTGTEKDVDSITIDDVVNVYNMFYHPKNMFMVITGNFNPYEISALIKENQSKKKFEPYKKPTKVYKEELPSIVKESTEIKGNVNIPKLKIAYKVPLSKFKGMDKPLINLYSKILLNVNFGATSDTKEELLERELITSLSTNASFTEDYLTIVLSAETKYPNEVSKILKETYAGMKINKKNIERKAKVAIADTIYSFDNIEYVNSIIQDYIMCYDKIIDNSYDLYKNIDIEKANKVNSIIKTGECCQVIMTPKKDA